MRFHYTITESKNRITNYFERTGQVSLNSQRLVWIYNIPVLWNQHFATHHT